MIIELEVELNLLLSICILHVSPIKKMFPNVFIIIDSFHLTQLISRSLNKTRIATMKKFKNITENLKDIGN